MKKTKNIILSLFIACVTILSTFTLCACSNTKSSTTVNDIYSMGMVTAVRFLNVNNQSRRARKVSDLSDTSKSTITKFADMFDGLAGNIISPVESKTTQEDGVYNVYPNKLSLTINNEKYTMYFHEVIEGTTQEIDENEIETETKSFLYGIVVRESSENKIELNVVGSREIEVENKNGNISTESELKLLFSSEQLFATNTDSFDDIELLKINNYVLIEQELEDNEIEYAYTTKYNGTEKKVELEWDNNKKFEIEFEENGVKTKYKLVKLAQNYYEVTVINNNSKDKFFIQKENDNWLFKD